MAGGYACAGVFLDLFSGMFRVARNPVHKSPRVMAYAARRQRSSGRARVTEMSQEVHPNVAEPAYPRLNGW